MKDFFNQLMSIRKKVQKVGWPAAARLRIYDLAVWMGFSKFSVSVKPKNVAHAILMRAGTSDRQVFAQIFIQEEYESITLDQPRLIVDLGANVGYSSAYFLSKFPSVSVLAIEPDPSNYSVCCANLRPFGKRATVVHGAIWPESVQLMLDRGTFRDGREWATRVRPAVESTAKRGHVDGYDMNALLRASHEDQIDLLKIDIEGSETQLFSRNTHGWLPRVRNLCIELHGPDCEKIVFDALSPYAYEVSHSGSLVVFHNLRIRE